MALDMVIYLFISISFAVNIRLIVGYINNMITSDVFMRKVIVGVTFKSVGLNMK